MGARRRGVGLVASLAAATALVFACGDDDVAPTPVDAGVDSAKDVAAPVDVTITEPDPPKDTGAPEAAAPFTCADAGASVVDASACAVSFKTDILPLFGVCVNCHGTSGNKPAILVADANATWNALAAFTVPKVSRPLVNPCSTAVADSVLVQTVDKSVSASERGALMPPGQGLPSDVPKIKQWVQCGAPNN